MQESSDTRNTRHTQIQGNNKIQKHKGATHSRWKRIQDTATSSYTRFMRQKKIHASRSDARDPLTAPLHRRLSPHPCAADFHSTPVQQTPTAPPAPQALTAPLRRRLSQHPCTAASHSTPCTADSHSTPAPHPCTPGTAPLHPCAPTAKPPNGGADREGPE